MEERIAAMRGQAGLLKNDCFVLSAQLSLEEGRRGRLSLCEAEAGVREALDRQDVQEKTREVETLWQRLGAIESNAQESLERVTREEQYAVEEQGVLIIESTQRQVEAFLADTTELRSRLATEEHTCEEERATAAELVLRLAGTEIGMEAVVERAVERCTRAETAALCEELGDMQRHLASEDARLFREKQRTSALEREALEGQAVERSAEERVLLAEERVIFQEEALRSQGAALVEER